MLILPIVNKNRIMNVELKLRAASKVRHRVCYDDANQSEIIINRQKFSESSYINSKDESAPIDFIRSKSILHPRNFIVTTRTESDSSLYDVYEVAKPPEKVNDCLDKLYGKAITDLRKEIPGAPPKGRYVSFEKIGMSKYLTDDKIAKLQRIVKDVRDENEWPRLFQEAGIADLSETIDFINNFECVVLSDSTIPEDSLQDSIKALGVINSKDYRSLKNYYKMAKENTEMYTKISYISKLIYDKPLVLVQSSSKKPKQYVYKKDEVDYKNAA